MKVLFSLRAVPCRNTRESLEQIFYSAGSLPKQMLAYLPALRVAATRG